MKIWITSDHHFSHANIINYCNRPFPSVNMMNVRMMNAIMKLKWNEIVSKYDMVIYLGDFALCGQVELCNLRKSLNGTIIIIKGSHDRSKRQLAEAGFIVGGNPMYIDNYILSHVPLADSEIPKGMINIHGHIHEKATSGERINICVEHTNYYPVELKKVMRYKL